MNTLQLLLLELFHIFPSFQIDVFALFSARQGPGTPEKGVCEILQKFQ